MTLFLKSILVSICLFIGLPAIAASPSDMAAAEEENMTKYRLGEIVLIGNFVGVITGFIDDQIYYDVNFNAGYPAYLTGGTGGIRKMSATADRVAKKCRRVTGDYNLEFDEPQLLDSYNVQLIFENGYAAYRSEEEQVLLILPAPAGSHCEL